MSSPLLPPPFLFSSSSFSSFSYSSDFPYQLTDWGIPLDDGFEPPVALETLAPELRTVPVPPPTAAADMYALGRLAYFILSGGKHVPVDEKPAPPALCHKNLAGMLPRLHELELQYPGATDLLGSWILERQPIADGFRQQYLLLLSSKDEIPDSRLLDGR
mgnify:CR=1 FL=1